MSIALACSARPEFACVANSGSNNASGYTVNSATGALTPITGSPLPAGAFPISVTMDAAGKFAYVTNEDDNNAPVYSIDSVTGALTTVVGSPFPAGTTPK